MNSHRMPLEIVCRDRCRPTGIFRYLLGVIFSFRVTKPFRKQRNMSRRLATRFLTRGLISISKSPRPFLPCTAPIATVAPLKQLDDLRMPSNAFLPWTSNLIDSTEKRLDVLAGLASQRIHRLQTQNQVLMRELHTTRTSWKRDKKTWKTQKRALATHVFQQASDLEIQRTAFEDLEMKVIIIFETGK